MVKFLKWLANPSKDMVSLQPDEIVPGVEKPSVILTNMIASEILKDPKTCVKDTVDRFHTIFRFSKDAMSASFTLYRENDATSVWKTRDHVIRFQREKKETKRMWDGTFDGIKTTVENEEIFLESSLEKETLEKAIHEGLRLKEKILAQEIENAKQDKAMSLIEEFFTAKPQPKQKKIKATPKTPKLVADPLNISPSRMPKKS
mgnify:CR=1 FL=1